MGQSEVTLRARNETPPLDIHTRNVKFFLSVRFLIPWPARALNGSQGARSATQMHRLTPRSEICKEIPLRMVHWKWTYKHINAPMVISRLTSIASDIR